jgi:hypothetical protein
MSLNGLTNLAINDILSKLFGNTTFAVPATFYIALSTTTPTASGTNFTEPAGNAYARASVTNNTTNFPASTTESSSNATLISFPQATGAWGTVTYIGIYDSATVGAGNCWAVAPLTASEAIVNGMTFQLPATNLSVTMTQGSGPQGLTNLAINDILSNLFGSTAYSVPATFYVGLSTTTPTATGTNFTEPSGNAYARATVTNNTTNFPATSSEDTLNGALIQFAQATGTWGTVTYAGLFDALTGGNCWLIAPLSASETITSGMTFEFPASNLSISISA